MTRICWVYQYFEYKEKYPQMFEKLPNTHGEDVLPIQHRGMGSIPNQHFKVSQVFAINHTYSHFPQTGFY